MPGVAIATALMPPLCTVGIGISQSRWSVSGGALFLFLVNFIAIVFASSLTFALLGFLPSIPSMREVILSRALAIAAAPLLLVIVLLTWLTRGVIADAVENRTIGIVLTTELTQTGESSLVSFERHPQPDYLAIVATVRSAHGLSYSEAMRIQEEVAVRLQRPVALKLMVVPVTSLDPLVPPTYTPTAPPDATVTPTPTPTPTITLAPTKIATSTQIPTQTAAPTQTPTSTATPTATATLTPTHTPPPSPTPTPVAHGVIGGTGRRGANVRRHPGFSAVVVALPDGEIVELLSGRVTMDSLEWVQVGLADGQVGWIAEDYIVPYRTPLVP
jgi:hypothetical protein